ncbi:hypothetical protein FUAX_43370 (plasmid) [Fulvitalea axinellae]|uniref:Uncharacterized protein n=1 Tax=Fulvitalea axinellae TaxID=1182444 RepID=A0AAU9DKX8_9BACT|nr:hypothetical protein FUAX_43370 [Fulvitalea axinellae]
MWTLRQTPSHTTQKTQTDVDAGLSTPRPSKREHPMSSDKFRAELEAEDPELFQTRAIADPFIISLEKELDLYAQLEACEEELRLCHPFWSFGQSLEKFIDRQQALFDQKFMALDHMEHAIYHWYSIRPARYLEEERQRRPFSKSVFALLDRLAEEHRKLTARLIDERLEIWTPDRDKLPLEEQYELQSLWRRIVYGSGTLSISGHNMDEENDDYRNDQLANIMKLLTRPAGRQLISQIDSGGKRVSVCPPKNNEGDDHCKPDTWFRPNYAAINTALPFDESNPIPADLAPTPGLGFPSKVVISDPRQKTLDSSFYATTDWTYDDPSEYRNVPYQQIPVNDDIRPHRTPGSVTFTTPFVDLAHELGHAQHNQQGLSIKHLHAERFRRQPKWKYWTNLSEYAVINHWENGVRQEHGVPSRLFHLTTPLKFRDFLS